MLLWIIFPLVQGLVFRAEDDMEEPLEIPKQEEEKKSQKEEGDTLSQRGKELHVFDFDGTLFASPMPSQQLWQASVFGLLRDSPKTVPTPVFLDLQTAGRTWLVPRAHYSSSRHWFVAPN